MKSIKILFYIKKSMNNTIPKIHPSWLNVIWEEFEKDYMKNIKKFLIDEIEKWEIIYPAMWNIFNALNSTPLDKIKVVILGQDPYHGPGQAHGLSFSVPDWIRQPPSLQNIFKELNSDIWMPIPTSWNLTKWANSWVLLLNAVLTVRANTPTSHSKIWWETFTDSIIKAISDNRENIVFLLWGSFAQSKENLIDSKRHLVLKAAHPSPFSSYRWFFGCKHFSKTNEYLVSKWLEKIDWSL